MIVESAEKYISDLRVSLKLERVVIAHTSNGVFSVLISNFEGSGYGKGKTLLDAARRAVREFIRDN